MIFSKLRLGRKAASVVLLLSVSAIVLAAPAATVAASSVADPNLPAIKNVGAITSMSDDLMKNPNSPISKLVDENDCQRKVILPETQPPLKAGDDGVLPFFVEISGPGCPIAYRMELKGTQLKEGFEAVFTLNYVAQSDEAKKMYDVSQMTYTGQLMASVHQDASGGTQVKAKFAFSGEGQSQTYGAFKTGTDFDLQMTIAIGAPPSNPTGNGGIPFPNIKVSGQFSELTHFAFQEQKTELGAVAIIDGFSQTATYTIDQTVVSEAEYKSVRDSLKLPAMEKVGDKPNAGPLMQCSVAIYDAKDLSTSNADTLIRNGKLPQVSPIADDFFCGGKSLTSTKAFSGKQLMSVFDVQPAHVAVRVSLCFAVGPCVQSERAFLTDEAATYSDSLGAFTLLTSCKPTVACGVQP